MYVYVITRIEGNETQCLWLKMEVNEEDQHRKSNIGSAKDKKDSFSVARV